jgi:hypothetical protein
MPTYEFMDKIFGIMKMWVKSLLSILFSEQKVKPLVLLTSIPLKIDEFRVNLVLKVTIGAQSHLRNDNKKYKLGWTATHFYENKQLRPS